jgi:arylformamidase
LGFDVDSEQQAAAHWRGLSAQARERAYSPSSCIGGNYRPFIDAYQRLSAQARAQTRPEAPGHLNLRWGPGAAHTLDLFVPSGGLAAPLLVFVHGGYWQELSKDEASFPATACVQRGFAYAALNHTLAPAVGVMDIVAECQRALDWLRGHAQALRLDAQRFVVAGSSAGAHVAAMLALRRVGVAPVQGAVLVSGIYELEPLVGTSINQALGLTVASAHAASPALACVAGFPPSVVCWGAVETAEFKRQSRSFGAQLRQAGCASTLFEVERRNHFDIVLDLTEPGTLLGDATLALLHSV